MTSWPRGTRLKPKRLVIGLVADEEHEGVAGGARRIQRTPDEGGADAPVLEGRIDGERAQHQARLLAGPDRRQAHRPDEERADERREGQFGTVRRPLADAVGGARETARAEGALVQTLDGVAVGGGFGPDDEREFGHGRCGSPLSRTGEGHGVGLDAAG